MKGLVEHLRRGVDEAEADPDGAGTDDTQQPVAAAAVVEAATLALDLVQKALEGRTPKKIVVVPNRIVNVVV